MTDIFREKNGKEIMVSADDPQFAPAVQQWPRDAPYAVLPDLWAKKHWPAHVENITRPRFGRDQG
jgi:hypothetical protein